MHLIDTHCHLDDERYLADLDEVLVRTRACGVEEIIIPAASPSTLKRAHEIANTHKNIYFACGLHPCEVNELDSSAESKMGENAESSADSSLDSSLDSSAQKPLESKALDYRAFLDSSKCVAIGECGLDYYYFTDMSEEEIAATKARQKALFIEQIELSIARNLPLIVHIRDASNDAFEILSSFPQARGVLHCYNADRILLNLSERFCYGIGGVATFKNARRLIEALPLIPLERIVLETDAPYLTPHPHRGARNSPEYIPLIAARVAEVLGIDAEELARISTNNALSLFNLSKNAV